MGIVRPVLQQLEKRVAERGGDEFMLDAVREGRYIKELMRTEFDLSESMFYRWVHANEEREVEWRRARADSGHVYADKAIVVLEDESLNTAPTSSEVNLANSRARAYQWRASKVNRSEYGDDALVNIHNEITTGDLHLDALLKHGLPAAPEESVIEEADFFLIEGDVADEFEDLEDTWVE